MVLAVVVIGLHSIVDVPIVRVVAWAVPGKQRRDSGSRRVSPTGTASAHAGHVSMFIVPPVPMAHPHDKLGVHLQRRHSLTVGVPGPRHGEKAEAKLPAAPPVETAPEPPFAAFAGEVLELSLQPTG